MEEHGNSCLKHSLVKQSNSTTCLLLLGSELHTDFYSTSAHTTLKHENEIKEERKEEKKGYDDCVSLLLGFSC